MCVGKDSRALNNSGPIKGVSISRFATRFATCEKGLGPATSPRVAEQTEDADAKKDNG
jgi:hypothetical protein